MRNLKKALALVMVFALVLGTVASAASFTDVDSSYGYVEEVELLADLGVLAGFPDGSYQPEATITRVQAAAVIYRILTGRSSAAMYEGATKFYDVAATYWGTGYINYCADIGAIGGYPDGSFRPDQAITVAEYESMLVRALGLTEGKTLSYPNGYIALADANLINEDIPSTISSSSAADRGLVAKLTYNTMVNATYQTLATDEEKSPKIIEKIFKIVPYEGVITATQFETNGAEGVNATGKANKFAFDAKDDEKDGTYTFAKVTADMIGTSAKMYLRTDAFGATSVYAVVPTGKNLVVTVPVADIGDADDGKGDYYKVNGVKNYIEMGAAYPAGAGTKILSKVTIVSNDGDDTDAEYVFVKSYTYTEYQETIGDKIYTEDVVIDTKADDDTALDVSFDSAIAEGDKVLVYKNAAGTVAEIIKCSVTQATLDGLSGSGDSTKYTFDGATKSVLVGSEAAQELSAASNLGKVGKFVVAPFFNLVVETSSSTSTTVEDYYYLKAATTGTGFDSGKNIVKVVNTQGETLIVTFKSGVTLGESTDLKTFTDVAGGGVGGVDPDGVDDDLAAMLGNVFVLDINSSDEITSIELPEGDVRTAGDAYAAAGEGTTNLGKNPYSSTTGLLEVATGTGTILHKVNDSSVFFVVEADGDIYVYIGTFPATAANNMQMVTSYSKDDAYSTMKVAKITANEEPASTTGTNVYGMLLDTGSLAFDGDKVYANFKIAMNGEVKTYSTVSVDSDDAGALTTFTNDSAVAKGTFVKFEMAGGKIAVDSNKNAFEALVAYNSEISYATTQTGNIGYVADLSGNLLAVTDEATVGEGTATNIKIFKVAADVKVYEVDDSDIGAATVSATGAARVITATGATRTKIVFEYDRSSSDEDLQKVTEIYVIK